jgi:hypothetical protein
MRADRKRRPPSEAGKADPEQSARFIEGARELGCEENLSRLGDALRQIAKARPQHRADPRSAKDEKPLPD